MLLVAALLAAAAVTRRSRRRRRLAGWTHTTGEVVAEEGVLNTRASARSFLPVVRLRFTTPDGQVVEATPRSGTYAGGSRVGRAVTVVYDPQEPTRFDAWPGRDRTGWLLGGVALGLVALAALAQL
ncbi:DUF3592 domain-containing protein [Nitriliruptor alkaliphilus]|uniref:DUF3592 domain-containing protein n=1 Tax=Nitriliruptor alkaliphilus TaxID=427918 RepID=UPI00069785B9|nr:DUF3592 domain-containing protein [Nitriliruptor alkaliphilus]